MRHTLLVAIFLVGCASSGNRRLAEDERRLALELLPGCAPQEEKPAELVLYCPDQALLLGVKEVKRQPPKAVFDAWVEELRGQTDGKLEVVERSPAGQFGNLPAEYFRVRTDQMPEGGFVEGYVAAHDQGGRTRRVWCSATSSEPSGIYRCEQELASLTTIALP